MHLRIVVYALYLYTHTHILSVSCSLTHSAVCPLDVVKTKLQTDPNLYQKSIKEAIQIIVKSDGIRVLFSGLAATFSGYFLQGFCKFGFYDLIKTKFYKVVKNEDNCARFRLPILLLSATSGMYMYICVHMYLRQYIYRYAYMHACISMHTYTYKHAYLHTRIFKYTHIYMYVYTYLLIYTYRMIID
jgi:hypothetical protein